MDPKPIFDIYRDWPFLGIIAGLAFGIVYLFRHYSAEGKDQRDTYQETLKDLWSKHKNERDELRNNLDKTHADYKQELQTREDRANQIMEELITTLRDQNG